MNLHLGEASRASSPWINRQHLWWVDCCVGLCQGFTRVMDVDQILFQEICFRRKTVLPYSEGFT